MLRKDTIDEIVIDIWMNEIPPLFSNHWVWCSEADLTFNIGFRLRDRLVDLNPNYRIFFESPSIETTSLNQVNSQRITFDICIAIANPVGFGGRFSNHPSLEILEDVEDFSWLPISLFEIKFDRTIGQSLKVTDKEKLRAAVIQRSQNNFSNLISVYMCYIHGNIQDEGAFELEGYELENEMRGLFGELWGALENDNDIWQYRMY